MAPTETLAEQHFATLQRLIGAEPVRARCSPARRRRAGARTSLGKLASGELSLVVGTHALIEPDVHFRALAVAVVDEQHRFGVRQRAALDAKGAAAGGREPEGEQLGAARAAHDRHADPAHARARELRRPGRERLRELPRGGRRSRRASSAGERARARAYEQLREQLAQAGRRMSCAR